MRKGPWKNRRGAHAILDAKENAAGRTHRLLIARARACTRGRGAGTSASDLHNPTTSLHGTQPATSVDDDRRGKSFCEACGAEVACVEVEPGRWQKRDGDGLPHMLSCVA